MPRSTIAVIFSFLLLIWGHLGRLFNVAIIPHAFRGSLGLVCAAQGFSKVEGLGKGLIRVRGEASDLASDIGHLMEIHQGEDHGVEYGQHLSHRREADATAILSQRHVASPVETIFHRPMSANQLQKTFGGTPLWRKTRPAIDHLDALLAFYGTF